MRETQKRIDKLNAEQADLLNRMEAIRQELDKGAETLTAEQIESLDAEFEAAEAKFEANVAKIAQEQKLADREKAFAAARAFPSQGTSLDVSVIQVGDEAIQADKARGFRSISQFATCVQRATMGQGVDDRLSKMAAATGQNQTIGSEGGFLVPPAFSTAIWDGLNDPADSLVSRCDQLTVEGESLTVNANAETSRATGSRYGGIQVKWIAEADQLTNSKVKFRQVKLEPQQLAALVPVTDKLLANAPALEQYISRAVGDEMNFVVGNAILNGTGAGQPKGFMNSAAKVSVPAESGQAAATIVHQNIVKMWSRLHRRARANAVWYINQDIEPQLHSLGVAVGTGGLPAYMPPNGLADSPYATLLGRPVVPIEFCETLGTEGDIILADLQYYLVGTRGGVDTAMSMHLRFDYAETVFRFMFAIDGQPWLAAPLTPFKGTGNTQSPFITLATRS